MIGGIASLLAVTTAAGTAVFSQTPSRPEPSDRPTFDVISIKPHPEDGPVSNVVYQRPDGGFSLTALPASHLIGRAYGLKFPDDIVGLPDWAKTELFDVSATSSLSRATTDDRLAMWRAMLADRFGLVAHLEKRTRLAYDLVLARADGKLGPGLTRVAVDCDAEDAKRGAAALAPGLPSSPLPEMSWSRTDSESRGSSRFGLLLAGEMSVPRLVMYLRNQVGRMIVDKTGLSGSYRVRLTYDQMASRLTPDSALLLDAGPTLWAALQQQLGLRLRSTRAAQDPAALQSETKSKTRFGRAGLLLRDWLTYDAEVSIERGEPC
jgi:uncharacterized protein (TIGR03435 family)